MPVWEQAWLQAVEYRVCHSPVKGAPPYAGTPAQKQTVLTFRQSIMTPAIWWIMLLPAEASGIAAFWLRVHFSFLKTLYTELVPTTLLLTWILANYFDVINSRGPFDFIDYRELVDFDYLVVILTFIIPWRRWYNDQTLDFRHMAISNGCHPLFFALPVLVGASTSVIFPMGSMALALMNSVTNVGVRDMVRLTMAAGLMTKLASVSIVLLLVNTVGYFIFDWKVAPKWLEVATGSTNDTKWNDPLPL
ncbi:hypothetical protein HPB48_012949 [Haemaphysalis longicornis]|uniref:Uncharacterized protein n=1 Tax=Haemaphysalis longicornis TaxID=44386 RepID=A0A9J6FEI5_HAELO|nr:hypothetical protein HPB48_012949 [Haemaphysalis longicornis]